MFAGRKQMAIAESLTPYNFLSYWANKHSNAVSQYIFTQALGLLVGGREGLFNQRLLMQSADWHV
jgi:hypothetical protein